jgi:hypothetical protein
VSPFEPASGAIGRFLCSREQRDHLLLARRTLVLVLPAARA